RWTSISRSASLVIGSGSSLPPAVGGVIRLSSPSVARTSSSGMAGSNAWSARVSTRWTFSTTTMGVARPRPASRRLTAPWLTPARRASCSCDRPTNSRTWRMRLPSSRIHCAQSMVAGPSFRTHAPASVGAASGGFRPAASRRSGRIAVGSSVPMRTGLQRSATSRRRRGDVKIVAAADAIARKTGAPSSHRGAAESAPASDRGIGLRFGHDDGEHPADAPPLHLHHAKLVSRQRYLVAAARNATDPRRHEPPDRADVAGMRELDLQALRSVIDRRQTVEHEPLRGLLHLRRLAVELVLDVADELL